MYKFGKVIVDKILLAVGADVAGKFFFLSGLMFCFVDKKLSNTSGKGDNRHQRTLPET